MGSFYLGQIWGGILRWNYPHLGTRAIAEMYPGVNSINSRRVVKSVCSNLAILQYFSMPQVILFLLCFCVRPSDFIAVYLTADGMSMGLSIMA